MQLVRGVGWLRGAVCRQRREHSGRHGSAHEAAQDQQEHEYQGKNAAHGPPWVLHHDKSSLPALQVLICFTCALAVPACACRWAFDASVDRLWSSTG